MGHSRSVVAAIVAIASTTAARADVGVIPIPSARPAASSGELVTAVVRASGARADAWDQARRAWEAGAVPAPVLEGFARVARLEAAGWRAYLEVDTAYAAARLASARSEAEALLALPGGAEVYAEVALRLGLVLSHAGRGVEATEVLRLAHALDRERAVTAAEFSPDAVAAYQAALADQPPERAVTLTAPAGARLIVDGVAVGAAPVPVTLAHGQHIVVARAPGREPRGVAVSVGPATDRIAIELAPARDGGGLGDELALVAGATEARAGAAIADALIYAELDEVLVVASVFRGGGPALLGQRCVLARPACTAVVEIGHEPGGIDAAARLLVERLRAATPRYGVLVPGDPRVSRGESRRDPDTGCRWCRSRWLYVGGGAVAAAVIASLVLAVTADEPAPTITLDPGDFTGP